MGAALVVVGIGAFMYNQYALSQPVKKVPSPPGSTRVSHEQPPVNPMVQFSQSGNPLVQMSQHVPPQYQQYQQPTWQAPTQQAENAGVSANLGLMQAPALQ